jgi:filamentous hemagglutinin
MTDGVPRPPMVGELLPYGAAAFGVRNKLAGYALNLAHRDGGPKARGFERILGITIDDIDYLEAVILDGARTTPIGSVRDRPPHGIRCVVDIPVRGVRSKSERIANVRTAWLVADAHTPPRLVSVYIKP